MSYNPNYCQQAYQDYVYEEPDNTTAASPSNQMYYSAPSPAYDQYYYQPVYQQQGQMYPQQGHQYPPYSQYPGVQWVQDQGSPGHSYRHNRPRGRGGGSGGQGNPGRQQHTSNTYYNQSHRQNHNQYEPNSQYAESAYGTDPSQEVGHDESTSKARTKAKKDKGNGGNQRNGTSGEHPQDRGAGQQRYDNGGSRRQHAYGGRQDYQDFRSRVWKSKETDGTSTSAGGKHEDRPSKSAGGKFEDRPSKSAGGKFEDRPSKSAGGKFEDRRSRGDDRRTRDERGARPAYGGQHGHARQKGKVEDESQRGTLQNLLSKGKYECMVCYDNVRCEHAIWSCCNCFHVFHLHCIKKWARTSTVDNRDCGSSWRCPGCQNVTEKVPNQYRCYCGKLRDPTYSQYETAHSCGEMCGKQRKGDCPHPCTLLCHPGPCPPCSASVNKTCDCGKLKKQVRCGHDTSYKCDAVCEKPLNCGKHECAVVCHPGACVTCVQKISQECYGNHTKREVVCGSEQFQQVSYSCDTECRKSLKCGNHTCEQTCHPGDCGPCPLIPSLVTHCQCGQTTLDDIDEPARSSCVDPVPVCDKICSKVLPCGPQGAPHKCDRPCHTGECGPCEGETTLKCVCGAKHKAFHCSETAKFTVFAPYKCERRCGKKKMCSRHKCTDTCCTKDIHICEVTCSKKLKCGRHKCKALCHRGNCQPCLIASFDELTCHCGAEVIMPPVPCGSRPPECHQLCIRDHGCQHTVRHTCHNDGVCPPCTELMEKLCMGGHETRKNIPCHMTDISCGRPCGKMLVCGIHTCIRVCHKDVCQREGEVCTQPCSRKREDCSHPCGAPCHPDDPCPKVPCKTEISIKCPCGHRSAKVACNMGGEMSSNIAEFQKLTVQQLSSGRSLDIATLSRKGGTRSLDCDEECAKIERNRRVALALEIKNPDLQSKLGNPPYTDFIKDYAKKYPKFVSDVEKALNDLVHMAKQSKHVTRSHAFQPMTRDQRRLIHELAEFYGCETQSYDFEPKKNVVATAKKDKSWLPSICVTSLVQREMCPNAPPPIPHLSRAADLRQGASTSKHGMEVLSDSSGSRKEQSGPAIDYFDFSVG